MQTDLEINNKKDNKSKNNAEALVTRQQTDKTEKDNK